MPPKADISLLFHPKKNKKQEKPAGSPSPRKPIPPRPKPQADDDEGDLKLPDGPYQEFKLMSSALNGWKYDVMKFDSRKPIDINRWAQPIKLNRKELRRDDGVADQVPEAVAPMLGPDGKPVIGIDGKMVMVDAEGKPIHPTSGNNNKGKGPNANGKKRFQKKTKQVFVVPEEVRQLRREERYPWVMEDSSPAPHTELWIGQMEEVAKSETHAFFMPAANDVFKFVPAHRWYKFQKKLKHDLPTNTADVESLFTLSQKRDPQAWLATRNGKGPSAATAAMFKAEAEGRTVSGGSSLVYSTSQSLGPGGRKLKTVDSGGDLFGDDDGEGRKGRAGEDGDMDEQVYEEDFADDEEQMEVDDKDEEAKEIEERIKREYQSANKQNDTGVDAPSDDEEKPAKNKQTKAMQKLIRQIEGNEAYESDEEENPYASSVEEEEEEEPVVSQEPAVQQQPQQVDSRASSQAPPTNSGARPNMPASNPSNGQPNSPPGSPAIGGGHSIVAKRATSPKPPKTHSGNISRSNSPLGSRPTSPVAGSRGTSPGVSRAGSPVDPKQAIKRKATEDLSNGATSPHGNGTAPKLKKRKGQVPGSTPGVALPPEQLRSLLIDWLGNTPNASTRDCIHHFTQYLTDSDKKTEFSKLVREVAQLKDGVLVLRKRFQEGGSNAPSPAPASAA